MKKMLLFASLISVLTSCNSAKPPKDVAKEFIQAVYSADAAKASNLVTEKTKVFTAELKGDASDIPADESFSLATLTETISGSTAEVKNDLVKLSLEKEADGWKVAANPELIASINNRQSNLAVLKAKWEALQKEYEGKLLLAKDYVQYKKGQGVLSPQMKTLEQMVNTLSVKTAWDKEKILLYVQRQQQLADLIDKSVEPSFTANTDMSMNYILQLSNANDRIKAAQKDYQAVAEKTPSTMYPSLAMK